MIELEKKYLPSNKGTSFTYTSQLVGCGVSFEEGRRYSYRKDSIGGEPKKVLLRSPERNISNLNNKNSLVNFLFHMEKYETSVFSKEKGSVKGQNPLSLKSRIASIKQNIEVGEFLAGCALKQVKGGFTIDFEGLICFMPYSLSEGTRFMPYTPKPNAVQLFQAFGLSLVAMREQELYLNVILSRKNNVKFLKTLLKNLFKSGFFNKRPSLSRTKKFNGLKSKNIKLRLIGDFCSKGGQGSLKLVKEVFVFKQPPKRLHKRGVL